MALLHMAGRMKMGAQPGALSRYLFLCFYFFIFLCFYVTVTSKKKWAITLACCVGIHV